MTIKKRFYDRERDYNAIYRLLTETYESGGKFTNWLPPRWEYMHYHSYYNDKHSSRSGVWEEGGEIVAVVHNELGLGEAFFTLRPGYTFLKSEMLNHAEEYLFKIENERKKLIVHCNDFDSFLRELLISRNYTLDERYLVHHTICFYPIDGHIDNYTLPPGFSLKSLADDNDLVKVDRVQWRGFNHEGEPPIDGIEARKLMQSAPNFQKELTIVAVAPNGDFASYVGMWFCGNLKIAYVEPVCTDPDYRRLGLGKAALMESIRRCGELGAHDVVVESSLPIYLSAGFTPRFVRHPWVKIY